MKASSRKNANRLIAAMLVVVALAIGFWVLLLSPKRSEADKLSLQVESLETSLATHTGEVEAAEAAKKSFSGNYARLVVLGKAVPAEAETASLIVQIQKLAERSKVHFGSLTLESAGGSTEGEAAAPAPAPGTVTPTEAAASLMPLGATIGPAGLAVMPYSLTFEGNFFKIADFVERLDNLVKTENEKVAVDGRLFTVDSFSLEPGAGGFPALLASFSITTFLTPPGQNLAEGTAPAATTEAATLAASTTTVSP
jgi:Tfp pilus assembly protein PilO